MNDYITKATDPAQYDSDKLDWRVIGDQNDQSRKFFQENLLLALEDIKGKKVLDIGSGVGQLFPTLKRLGAKEIQGIEPSKRNTEHSNKLYPDIIVHNTTLQNFVCADFFDVGISIAVFEHILDLNEAFLKIAKLIKQGGTFYLIIGDKEYNTKSRVSSKGIPREVQVQDLGSEVVCVKTLFGENGGIIIYDIFRPLETVIESAKLAGLKLEKKMGLKNAKGNLTFHLLVFRNVGQKC